MTLFSSKEDSSFNFCLPHPFPEAFSLFSPGTGWLDSFVPFD